MTALTRHAAILLEVDPGHTGPRPACEEMATWARAKFDKEYDGEKHDFTMNNLWSYHGPLAPLIDASCALSVPWPEGYDWRKVVGKDGALFIEIVYQRHFGGVSYWTEADCDAFPYTHPHELPASILCACRAAHEDAAHEDAAHEDAAHEDAAHEDAARKEAGR